MTDLNGKTKVTPSKHNPFFGAVLPDTGMTLIQERKAEAMRGKLSANQHRYDLPETYKVRTVKPNQPAYAAVDFDYWVCPVVSVTKDRTSLRVIAPDGSEAWVAWEKR